MKRTTLTLIALLTMLMIAGDAFAKTYVNSNGQIGRRLMKTTEFTIDSDEEIPVKLSLSCSSYSETTGTMDVEFFKKNAKGVYKKIKKLDLHFKGKQDPVSDTFKIEPGEYKVEITVRYMQYSVRLEDDE